ncbi:hypothetical protein SCHPADRAFT_276261 [Schizopora paradoxa]|uniref:CUE domain-containing protein n=1 Tax=Schizopora paradoxa TaxID=27342 RepID=A0A0H2RTK0_9AGAM|nr:hypothetical protein SCHPADRAFT_276261 [Schizopora paradoxa]
MSEFVNVAVAVVVAVFIFRWATSSSETPEQRNIRTTLGFKPKNVTQDMIDTVTTMFPDMPVDNIRYDLLRTGNVEVTTNKIIERGYLDAPPASYFRIYPRADLQPQQGATATTTSTQTNAAASSSKLQNRKKDPSLIERFHLESRVSSEDVTTSESESKVITPEEVGKKSVWESNPEAREASLKERKAQMILAARRRLQEQSKKAPSPTATGSD